MAAPYWHIMLRAVRMRADIIRSCGCSRKSGIRKKSRSNGKNGIKKRRNSRKSGIRKKSRNNGKNGIRKKSRSNRKSGKGKKQ